MAKISVTTDKYPNIIVAYLFDKMFHPEKISAGNEEFNEVMKLMKAKGFMPILRDYYLTMDPINRYEYKMIKRTFEGKGGLSRIEIEPAEKEKQPGLIKKIIKKIVGSTEFTSVEKNLLLEELGYEEEENNG